MDFFEAQDQARKKSLWLVLYFLTAVICIILAIYGVVSFIFFNVGEPETGGFNWLSPLRLALVAGSTILVIGLASLFKIAQLRQGGGVVAKSVGGKKVHPETRDFKERQLLNVIEEMTIASGSPMPEVYILENETGINAFAAGFSPNDAAIAVTRGTLDQLSRDELQGVIAHEFSHILNGDMRLNIKLGGILFGILVLAITGRTVMYALRFSGGRSSRGNDKGGGGLVLAIFLTGLALFIIGYIGIFFGRLIQAAVSRQREYLADASAVQFTRNPSGIVGALKKIGGFSQKSALENGKAMNIAHMCFGRIGKSEPLFFSLATHPPLVKRIQAIDPAFEGSFSKVQPVADKKKKKQKGAESQMSGFGQESSSQPPPLPPQAQMGKESRFKVGKTALSQSVGLMAPEQISAAREQIQQIPRSIQQAKQDTGAARAVILALVFDRDPSSLLKQMNAVRQGAAPETAEALHKLSIEVRKLPDALRLPVLETMIPVLYHLPAAEYETFLEVLQQCVDSDKKTDFWEFVLLRMIRRQVEPRIYKKSVDQASIRHKSVRSVLPYVATLFNFLVRQSHADPSSQQQLLDTIRGQEKDWSELPWKEEGELDPQELGKALDELTHASFAIRKKIIDISRDAVSRDGTVTLGEAEGLRMLSISLDCPLGTLLPSD